MTTPSSQFLSQLLLLLPPLLTLVITLAGAAQEQQPRMPYQDCPKKCGDVDVAFPFGIGAGCFRHGFEVLCNDSFVPPRAFVADEETRTLVSEVYASDGGRAVFSPVELVSISVGTGEARAYAPVSYDCRKDFTSPSCGDECSDYAEVSMEFSFGSPLAMSATRNVLTGVGWSVSPLLGYWSWWEGQNVPDQLSLTCVVDQPNDLAQATNGSCTGRGCCDAPFPPHEGPGKSFTLQSTYGNPIPDRWKTTPCIYGMVVDKSGYSFSTPDLYGRHTLLNRFPRGVQIALDFAAGNTWCPAEGQPPPPDYACVSANTSCANATSAGAPGYFCKCLDNYAGNPYVPDGCQDVDECQRPDACSNGGICKNKPGGYDCPCKVGMKDDGKGGTCTEIFPKAAKAAVGAIGGIFLLAILSFLVILHKEKKKMKEFYKNNGGPTLEKANVIKLFRKGDLKPILKSNNLIGKGCFGEVYKGLLDDKLVAIKKPINGSVPEKDQFANEVIIQSQVIHKNIVRLVGCCLEVDAPMLVYEFISQGSLHDILHNNNNNNKVLLDLDTRLNIAAQSADGLAYMHSKANIRILHGDVKPANILLDDNFVPKISDFGISRLLVRDKEHTGSVIGDMNYMDPVYLQEGLLTEKSDVYSFGVVILELISSRRALHSENNSLVKSFLEYSKKNKKMTELFDQEIAITEDLELLDSLAGMALKCLSLDVEERPAMMEVAEQLLILSRSRKV